MAKLKQTAAFKQFAPEDIYAGIRFVGSDKVVPHNIVYCEVMNHPTGIEFLDRFADLMKDYGHRFPNWYAGCLGIKTLQLTATVSTLTGCTFVDFMERYLLLLVTDLLTQTDSPVDAVARRTGFPRASELNQYLRRVCGRSPLEIRRIGRRRKAAEENDVRA